MLLAADLEVLFSTDVSDVSLWARPVFDDDASAKADRIEAEVRMVLGLSPAVALDGTMLHLAVICIQRRHLTY